jgi:hypothetical protein
LPTRKVLRKFRGIHVSKVLQEKLDEVQQSFDEFSNFIPTPSDIYSTCLFAEEQASLMQIDIKTIIIV